MSVAVTKAELKWMKKFVENYKYVLNAYPELFTADDIDDIKVVGQIIEEKLYECDENIDPRYRDGS